MSKGAKDATSIYGPKRRGHYASYGTKPSTKGINPMKMDTKKALAITAAALTIMTAVKEVLEVLDDPKKAEKVLQPAAK